MSYIEVNHLTKDYGQGRGVFDVSLNIERGETVGIVGINGAGKTTILRHLMGFVRPDGGACRIDGMDCWAQSEEVKRRVCYIPGEIAFPPLKWGDDFLTVQAEFWGVKDMTKTREITDSLQLDTTANLKRMSKGMKQKTAIAAAFMPDNGILLFDEPTTGLDPLMRNVFMELVERERKRGKTIIMSSHMFDEVEDCCDRIVMLKDGKIIETVTMDDIRHAREKTYKVEFGGAEDFAHFQAEGFRAADVREKYNQLFLSVEDKDINAFMRALSKYKIKFVSEIKTTLEDYFLKKYSNNRSAQ
jgi:ABC-2 type transport system ATP-binding protein